MASFTGWFPHHTLTVLLLDYTLTVLLLDYAFTHKDTENLNAAVTGTLSVLGHLALTLFDSGSTHSFISTVFVSQTKIGLKPLLHDS